MQPKNDTIAAIASAVGLGGVGVIRISGSEAKHVLQRIYANKNQILLDALLPSKSLPSFISHKLTHGFIVEWDTSRVIDEVLVVYMQAPATYTGEDTVEIYTHGGVALMQAVLKIVINQGARLAEPGEYTKRAFLNGKMDLTAAESVIDLINADNEKAILSAGRNLRGALSHQLYVARETLLNVIMLFEASIDFPEDVNEDLIDLTAVRQQLKNEVVDKLNDIHQNYEYGCYLKNGLKLAVVGRPNVGKSSLMNALLKQERVLVSEEAGTTRDVITERWHLGGFPVELADSAGIHNTNQKLETLGIKKSFQTINQCDAILFIFEANKGIIKEDLEILTQLPQTKIIGVANKTDLGTKYDLETSKMHFESLVSISVKNNQGLYKLENSLIEVVTQTSENLENMIIPNLRQTKLLEQIITNLARFNHEAEKNLPAEYLCTHLEEALKLINTILGQKVETDILDSIFSNFCIGK